MDRINSVLTDEDRFPLLKDFSFLLQLRNDTFAPEFNFESGDRLKTTHLHRVQSYADFIRRDQKFWKDNQLPEWIEGYLNWCRNTSPYYSQRPEGFLQQPTIRREDIRLEPWKFVSSDCDLDDLLVYTTSGTTGAPLDIVFDPAVQACYLPLLQSLLDRYNIQFTAKCNSVAIALICYQKSTLTYASLSTYLNGAGVLKLNLDAGEWKEPSDRVRYLEKYQPEVLTGDPVAFLGLLELRPAIRPKAIVSSAMKMTDGIRIELENYFLCPVIDIYSLTECRMIAYSDQGMHRAIRPDLYLEIFDKDKDVVLPYGERGELTITGGNNPYLPLIRYRTGDFCSIEIKNGIPYLKELEARRPVALYDSQGNFINSVDVSRKMMNYALAGFKLHQDKEKKITFTGWGDAALSKPIAESLKEVFGNEIILEISIQPLSPDASTKTVVYSSDHDIKF